MHFIAGILDHLPGLLALTCACYNSYHRLQPHFWSSAYTAWGPDNREGAVRVASRYKSDEEGTANAELKAADLSANPYLAFGALIAAGLDGVRRKLDPGEPTLIDPGNLYRCRTRTSAASSASRPRSTRRWTRWKKTPC